MLQESAGAHPLLSLLMPFSILAILFFVLKQLVREVKVSDNLKNTEVTFLEWWERNPGVYIGLSQEGRKLLREYIDASEKYYDQRIWIDGTEHLEYLNSLFYDLPPKFPDSIPEGKKDAQTGRPSS